MCVCPQALGIDLSCALDPPPDFYMLTESSANGMAINLAQVAFNSSVPTAGPVLVVDGAAVASGDAPFLAVLPGGATEPRKHIQHVQEQ